MSIQQLPILDRLHKVNAPAYTDIVHSMYSIHYITQYIIIMYCIHYTMRIHTIHMHYTPPHVSPGVMYIAVISLV